MRVRRATTDDIETIVHHRRAMFEDMGYREAAAMDTMCERFRPWLRSKMEAGEYLTWFVEADGAVASGAGLWLMDWPPHMIGRSRWRGNILNVYTEPVYRRRGMARTLMSEALEWCRANGVEAIILHASDEGRALYESFGFKATNEMRLVL
ncbi:MAG TPA: GNAT family N-acetyltransferase [Bryobacteraceae bacterium]|jgi:GNAT superfamily N-acetyltransferase